MCNTKTIVAALAVAFAIVFAMPVVSHAQSIYQGGAYGRDNVFYPGEPRWGSSSRVYLDRNRMHRRGPTIVAQPGMMPGSAYGYGYGQRRGYSQGYSYGHRQTVTRTVRTRTVTRIKYVPVPVVVSSPCTTACAPAPVVSPCATSACGTATAQLGTPGGGYVQGAPRNAAECRARGGTDTGRGCDGYR